jgi:phosphinothricin acetyltransferase
MAGALSFCRPDTARSAIIVARSPVSRRHADIPIRPAGLRDIAAITASTTMPCATAPPRSSSSRPDEPEMVRRYEALREGRYPYLVAELGGAIAGYAYAGPIGAAGLRWSVENSIYIDPRMQGRGIGRALARALIVAAQERGFRQMIAVIGDSPTRLDRAASRAGFRLVGTFDNVGFKFGRWLDSVLMQRPLARVRTEPEISNQ